MRQHVRLAANRTHESTITVDHEGGAPSRQRTHAPGSELTVDLTVCVAQQRKAQPVRFIELSLPINLISTDPHSLGTELGELGGQITEMAALLRSTRCHGLRVEEQHNGTGLDQVRERDGRTVLIEQLEILDEIAFVQPSLRIAGRPPPYSGGAVSNGGWPVPVRQTSWMPSATT